MNLDFDFFLKSVLLGVGLAMDAFSVSMANGLGEPTMKKSKGVIVAGVFAFFQAFMPMVGWACVHTIVNIFSFFEKMVPYIALVLLGFIGGKMIFDELKHNEEDEKKDMKVGAAALIIQGIATSIDALSVGFTISDYGFLKALLASLIIAAVTFVICIAGIEIGKKFGTKLAGKASILGGGILIAIGIEIFVKGII